MYRNQHEFSWYVKLVYKIVNDVLCYWKHIDKSTYMSYLYSISLHVCRTLCYLVCAYRSVCGKADVLCRISRTRNHAVERGYIRYILDSHIAARFV